MATEILRPNGAGDVTQLTIGGSAPAPTNWESVDESVADDGVTYVYGGGGAVYDLYNLPAHSGTGTITNVRIYYRGQREGGGHHRGLKTHGAEYWSAVFYDIGTEWKTVYYDWAVNPNTGLAWTWAEIDALQAGIKIWSPDPDTYRFTQVWVEVTYSPPQTISGAGDIPSGEAFGTPTLSLYLKPSAIPSAEAFGTPILTGPILVIGIASEEAFGVPTFGMLLFIRPSGIPSAEAFGVPRIVIIQSGGAGMKLPPGPGSGYYIPSKEVSI